MNKYFLLLVLLGNNFVYTQDILLFRKIDSLQLKISQHAANKNEKEEKIALSKLAAEYTNIAEYKKAIDIQLKLLKMGQDLKDEILIGKCYYNLGINYSYVNKFDEAKYYGKKALNFLKKDSISNKLTLAKCYNLLGSLSLGHEEYYEGKKYLLESEKIFKEANKLDFLISVYINRGTMELDLNHYNDAEKYYKKALALSYQYRDSLSISTCYINLNATYYNQTEFKFDKQILLRCLNYLDSAFLYVSTSPQTVNELSVYQFKYIIYNDLNQMDSAFHYAILYHELQTSIFDAQKINEIDRIYLRHNIALKNQENQTLLAKNKLLERDGKIKVLWIIIILGLALLSILLLILIVIRQKWRRNKKIREIEQQLAKAQTNPHFLFNAINSIQEYILCNDIETAHEFLVDFARLMRTFLTNSFSNYIDLEKEIATIGLYIKIEERRLKKKIEFEVVNNTCLDLSAFTIPTGLLQPIVENSIWHGFQSTLYCKIQIVITHLDSDLVVEVLDNGSGLQTSIVSKDSKGLILVKKRLELLRKKQKSYFEIENRSNEGGVRVRLILPIN